MAAIHPKRSNFVTAAGLKRSGQSQLQYSRYKLEGVLVEDLARTVHKLAGTDGMFGEVELGEKATAIERALRSGVEAEVWRKLAEELLAAA